MKVIVNTISTKKNAGGAFQISQNFLLKSLEHTEIEWYYITSQDLDDAIGERFSTMKGSKYFVFPTQPDFLGTYKKVKFQLREIEAKIQPDLVYSITAPSYFKFHAPEAVSYTHLRAHET